MPGPLEGVRVIDLTAVLLGPFATQHLADMGADVIKVEPPEGDLLRVSGGSMGRDKSMGPIYMAANRNKRSLCLDLKKPAACAVLKDLIRTADLFIHNSRPAAIERMSRALGEFKIAGRGVKTTIPFHQRVLAHERFRSGEVSTDFVEQYMSGPAAQAVGS